VVTLNAHGPDGLIDRKAPGQPYAPHRQLLVEPIAVPAIIYHLIPLPL
jgi:hypothetical protein